MTRHLWTAPMVRGLTALLAVMALAVAPAFGTGAAAARPLETTYTNPLPIAIPGDGQLESCPDPSIIRVMDTPAHATWYAYCTGDPHNDADRDATGNYRFHKIPIISSTDLAHWVYRGDVFDDPATGNVQPPAYAAPNSGYFAPDIRYFNGRYYLYYAVTVTNLPGGGSAIGVSTSSSPVGPWTDSQTPVVEPSPNPFCCGPDSRRDTIDPDVATDRTGQKYMFFGSYFGGIAARKLSADGLTTDPASTTQITIDNRYEAPYVWEHDGYYYLFASATNCCNGPLTGYSVFVGRSRNILGPYLDREGVSMLDTRVGGTPAISMNGNRWVGPGHNAVYTDFSGQDYMLYHAVDRFRPYFAPAPNFPALTRRPLLQDPLDWVDGWPTVRNGAWASDTPQPAPAAQPGERNRYRPPRVRLDEPQHRPLAAYSDEFNGALGSQWTWIRKPAEGTYGIENGNLRFDTQDAELYKDSNNASVLTEPEPKRDYIVETRLRIDFSAGGCTANCRFVQGAVVVYGNDDNYIKLDHVAIFDTRQTEFAKEMSAQPRYGNTVVGPPAPSPDGYTCLRIAVRHVTSTEETYRAYTSDDCMHWVAGGVWTHELGSGARIGLVSMGGPGYHTYFDYVRVYDLKPGENQPH